MRTAISSMMRLSRQHHNAREMNATRLYAQGNRTNGERQNRGMMSLLFVTLRYTLKP